MKKYKIFLGFSEVANYYTNLCKGFKELDIEFYFISYGKNIRNYDIADDKFFDQKIIHWVVEKIQKNKMNKIIYYPFFFVIRLYLFIKYLIKCNVFIFSYNASFLWLIDLPILKFFNKTIIYSYHGSDSRPPYLNGNYIKNNFSIEFVKKFTYEIYKKNKFIEKYADFIIGYPATCQFFSRIMINTLWIGLPIDLQHKKLAIIQKESSSIKIIHAPSSRKAKGSDYFKKIILELKNEGYKISYEELYNVPNNEVLNKIQNSDLVLDELYSDTTMAGLATEAAFFGVPSIVGGYHDNISKDLKYMSLPPSKYVDPDLIKKALIELIVSKDERQSLGKSAKEFVKKNWTPLLVAKKYLMLIKKEKLPEIAYYHQDDVVSFYGWAVNKRDLKNFLKEYIGKFGKEGLFLSHNKKLEKKILNFIQDKIIH